MLTQAERAEITAKAVAEEPAYLRGLVGNARWEARRAESRRIEAILKAADREMRIYNEDMDCAARLAARDGVSIREAWSREFLRPFPESPPKGVE